MADAMEVLRDAQTYFEGQGVHAALAEVVQQVVEERPPDALARMAQLLALKAGRKPAPPALCSYLDTIGNTPLISLNKCLPEGVTAARVLAKLEMSNPGGSLKDRIALNMIEKAEQAGRASPGNTTLVDFTSGNTGIGEAMVAAAKGGRAGPQPPLYAFTTGAGCGCARSPTSRLPNRPTRARRLPVHHLHAAGARHV